MSPKILASIAAAIALLAPQAAVAAPAAAPPQPAPSTGTTAHGPWTAAWGTAASRAFENEFFGENWSLEGFSNHSVRQVVRVSTGGGLVRIRLTNSHGTTPIRLTGATVAKTSSGAAIRPGTVRELRFHGRTATTLPAGGGAASDPVLLPTRPLEKLTVTLYFAGATGPTTFHEAGWGTVSYRATGDHRSDTGAGAYSENSHSWYLLAGVDVTGLSRPAGTVVAFGDSLTDGAITTPDAHNTYPDELAERLAEAGVRRGVVNAGINGNKVISDSTCFGERATARFERDALGQPRVRTVIVLEGINDIGSSGLPDFGCGPNTSITVDELIDGHRKLIRAAHRRGVTIIGCTLPPFKGAELYYTERNEAVRDALNHWIRTSGEYDAVVDLDRALADPADPERINPAYDAGDHLHPNDAGMKALAAAIPLGAL